MSGEDLQLEDIVLLQLFKDQIMNCGLDQVKASTERYPGHQTDFSDLEKALSDSRPSFPPAQSRPLWPDCHPMARLAGYAGQFTQEPASTPMQSCFKTETSLPRDLPPPRRDRTDTRASNEEAVQRLGKDEKLAKEAGIPFNVKQTLVGLPMDEFNDVLSKNDLSEEQLNICRDIRRRGKNKVAAQNCRQRKIEQIEELHGKLSKAMARRDRVRYEHQRLLSDYSAEADKLKSLTDFVLRQSSKDNNSFTLQVVGDDVKILPKTEVKEEDILPQPVSRYRMEDSHSPSYPPTYNNTNINYQENNQMYPRKQFHCYQNM